jgi:hypothetical protein
VSSFEKLTLAPKLRVLNSRSWALLGNGLTFWRDRMNDEDATSELRKRAVAEVNIRQRCVDSMLPIILAASHFVDEGVTAEVKFDASHRHEQDGHEVEDIVHQATAVTGHPHAWCRDGLAKQFGHTLFDNVESDPSNKVFLFEAEKTYAKAAAQYAATVLLINAGRFKPSRNDLAQQRMADMCMVAACSTSLKAAMSLPDPVTGLIDLLHSFETYPFVTTQFVAGNDDPVRQLWDTADLIRVLKEIEAADEADEIAAQDAAEARDHKKHLRDLSQQIASVTRKAETCTVITTAVTAGVAALKAAGMDDAAIGAIYGPIMAQMMGVPAAAAPAAQPLDFADETELEAQFKTEADAKFEAALQAEEAKQKAEDEAAAEIAKDEEAKAALRAQIKAESAAKIEAAQKQAAKAAKQAAKNGEYVEGEGFKAAVKASAKGRKGAMAQALAEAK